MRQAPTAPPSLFSLPEKGSKILFFSTTSQFFELYDYVLYGALLPILAPLFFPSHTPFVSMSLAFLSFSLTFLVAPLGAIFWGWYAEKFGQTKMLRCSLYLMGIPSLLIALLPSAEQIGLFAPCLLIMLRVLQGVSASGEIMGGKIFAMDSLNKNKHGVTCGLSSAAGALGVLLAIIVSFLVNKEEPFSWRLAMGLGAIICLLVRYVRGTLSPPTQKNNNNFNSLASILKRYPFHSLFVFSLGALLGILSYMLHTFINPYLLSLGHPSSEIYQASLLGLITTAFFSIFSGMAIDKGYWNVLPALRYSLVLILGIGGLSFCFFEKGGWNLTLAYCIDSALLGSFSVLSTLAMYYTFQARPSIRCKALLFNYAFGCALFGGLTPYFLHKLSAISHYYLPFSFILLNLVFFGIIYYTEKKITIGA